MTVTVRTKPTPRQQIANALVGDDFRMVRAIEDLQYDVSVALPEAITSAGSSSDLSGVTVLVEEPNAKVPDAVVAGDMAFMGDAPDAQRYNRVRGAWVLDTGGGGGGQAFVEVTAFENIAANSLVNVFTDAGVTKCRKADKAAMATAATGYVETAAFTGGQAQVYLSGKFADPASVTSGTLYLGAAGAISFTPATVSGEVSQIVGFAFEAGSVLFAPSVPILLA